MIKLTNNDVTFGDGGFYCLSCHKLYAKKSTQPNSLLTGPSFDGSYGVDTEDIVASPCIDFGSLYDSRYLTRCSTDRSFSQYFPDQTQYFTTTSKTFAISAIGQGSDWVLTHDNTATL